MPGCVCACQVFIVDECVMFFTALCQRLTVHLLRSGGRWYCHSAREGGGVDGRESGREVQKEKEWPSADSRSLYRSKVFSQWQLTGGKTKPEVLRYREEKETSLQTTSSPRVAQKDQAVCGFYTVMASAVPSKRMVSSFFITLASPHKATVTQQQQQPVLQAHSAPAGDKQHAAVRVSPSDSIPSAVRHKREDRSQSESYGSVDSKGQSRTGASARTSDPQSPKPVQTSDPQSPKPVQPGPGRGKLQEDDRGDAELFPPPPPPPPAALPSSLGTSLSDESALPPPPPAQTPLSRPLTSGQQPVYNREVETSTPSSGLKQDELSHGIHKNGQDVSRESRDVCGFCRKPVALSEPAIEALNRTYHDGCFQCRSCHNPLAGKQYYNKAGIPLCEDCYQASLELCWACGDAITDHVIRALERAYHPTCFTCATCKKQIGEQAFAQGEVGEVYCLQDYYRKYAPKCNACKKLIIPKEDGTDSYNVKCMGHSYHENCYRCEVCVIQLSPEPNEHGCYPLDGKMLCKSCHLKLVSGEQ